VRIGLGRGGGLFVLGTRARGGTAGGGGVGLGISMRLGGRLGFGLVLGGRRGGAAEETHGE